MTWSEHDLSPESAAYAAECLMKALAMLPEGDEITISIRKKPVGKERDSEPETGRSEEIRRLEKELQDMLLQCCGTNPQSEERAAAPVRRKPQKRIREFNAPGTLDTYCEEDMDIRDLPDLLRSGPPEPFDADAAAQTPDLVRELNADKNL